VERQRELSVLDALIDSACAGTGQLAFVEGPAGIGKSRLLTEARRAAVRRGATVLHARASQLEQEFSFGVARQLFEPVVIDPAERQALLHGAAGSAAAVFDLSSASATGDDSSFATLHGLYWLVVNLASRGPVVIVVDDIHWCDAGSLRFLAYLHRRLDGLTAALVLAHRSGEQHALGALIDDLRHDPATVSVRPVPLTRQAVAAMIGGRLGAVADEEFVDACFSGTTGNPLLVRQLLRALEADGIRPDRASAGVARALGSRAVSSMVLLRLRRLPQAAAVARALTILGDGAALPDVAQLAGVSETEAAELTRLLVAAEIIRPEPPLAFVHPLVRDAIYGDVPPGDRELLHEAAAQLLHGSGRSDEQVAAQLLQAPRRGQGWVVEVLRRAASDAVRRGSADGAVTFLKRALAEPPPRELRGQVLMELGLVETTTDGPAAGRDLQAAYETLADDASRATAALALTRTLVFVGQLGSPVRFAEDALRRLPDELVDERTAVLALQRIAGSMHGVAPERWNFDTEPPIPGTGYGSRMLQASVAYERMCRARPRADAVEMAAASLADGQLVNTDPGLLWVWSQVVLDLADEDVLPMWDSINATAHERGSLFSVLAVGFWRAWSLMRRGELAEAEHSIRIGMEQLDMWQRNAMTLPYGRAVLARVLYDQDRLDEARAVIRRDGEVPSRIDGARLVVEIEAEMLLSDRRPELALHRLETVLDRTPHAVNPAWRRDRLLWCAAAGAVGRVPEARERAEDLLQLARRWGAASTIGDVLLMLGRLDGADGIETLREAVAVLEGSPMRIRHADALISLGTRLAARDPGEATRALHAAHGIGCRTGAARIVRRAREALQAAGLPAPTEESATATTPTSTQRRILELLDAGATVPEIGQRLFLTPSTVQGHIDELRRRDAAASRAG
jgi:DNA-binding NarL/FixJ family response regulator